MKRLELGPLIGAAVLGSLGSCGLAAAATVPYPYIEVVQQGSDTGVAAVGATPSLTMQGTAVSIISGGGSVTSLSPTATFTLTATYSAALTAADGQPNTYDYNERRDHHRQRGSPALIDGELLGPGDAVRRHFAVRLRVATSPLTYTGGSLAGTLTGGEVVGSFTVNTASGHTALGAADLSQEPTRARISPPRSARWCRCRRRRGC